MRENPALPRAGVLAVAVYLLLVVHVLTNEGWETGSPSVYSVPPPRPEFVDHTLGQAAPDTFQDDQPVTSRGTM